MYTPKHLNLWTLPECYIGTQWNGYYAAPFGQNRDSDALGRSNFKVALSALLEVSDDIQIVREKHWACGWVEWIAIKADDFEALKVADELHEQYVAYPVLNEDHFATLEVEEAHELWKNYSVSERIEYIRSNRDQFEFTSFSDMRECVRGTYFGGYASELLGS